MIMRNLTIQTRLIIGFAIIVVIIATIGVLALVGISDATRSTEGIYNHPFRVSNSVRDIKTNIIAIHRSMKDIALAENDLEMTKARILVDKYENDTYDKFEIVFSQFLGDIKDVEQAYQSFMDWKEIREEVILLWSKGDIDGAISITKGKGAVHVQKVLDDVDIMIDFASHKADEFYSETRINERTSYNIMIFVIGFSLLGSILIVTLLARSIIIPLKSMKNVASRIDEGDFSAKNLVNSKDEINDLAKSFNKMTDGINLKNSVLSGLSEFSNSLHGLKSMDEFTDTILSKYIELTNAHIGAFFLLDKDTQIFSPVDSIGMDSDKLSAFSAENAPGEFGHVLHKKDVYVLNNFDNNKYFYFESFTGRLFLKEVISLPIIEDKEVVAIISCGNLNRFSDSSHGIFKQSKHIISTSFSTLLANIRTMEFAQKLAKTNETLELQSEELTEQAKELTTQSAELKVTSDNLQEQNIELEMQREEVVEANKLKSEFLSNMSHELRTPLNSINALSKVLIMQSSGKLDEEEGNYLKIIERNGKRLLSLINDILDLSKVEAGRMEINPKPFSLNSAVKLSVENLLALADEKGLKVEIEFEKDIIIESDEGRLHQVLTNLIGNAIKFTEKGEINISCKENDGLVELIIQDTGIGIDNDTLPNIFKEFRQGDGTTSRRYEGTGLGLAIANKITKSLNGNIHCSSKLGVGTTFTITIPSGRDNDISLIDDDENVTEIEDDKRTILIVDDDKEFITKLSNKLISEGYNVIRAFSGKEAIKLAIEHNPYAITLDIVMPEMDGWEVLQNLKSNKITSDIPVIIISSSVESDTSVALGAVGYIQKPVGRDDLINEINKINRDVKKILVVDDNEIDRLHISDIILSEDITVDSCKSGIECVKILENMVPDALILDLMMPEMSGFQTLNEIRSKEHLQKLPVIIVTAKDLTIEEKRYLNERAVSIIPKGSLSADIVDEVRKIIFGLNKESITKLSLKEKNILIIEDNETAVIQIRRVLEENDIKLHHALNGEEALDYLNDFIPDGIILDLMMPGMDGFEVLERLRGSEITKNIPVLVLTAKTLTKKDLSRLTSNNISQLVQKGDVDVDDLLSGLKKMIDPQEKTISQYSDLANKKAVPKTKKIIGKPKIVLIEDNPDNRTTIKAILGQGYEINEAEDGEIGLSMIRSVKPDLVLLDISLPKMDGFEVVNELRNDKDICDTPVIAVTAKAMKNDMEEIIAAGCDGYISKPIDDNELRSILSSYLS